MISILTVNIYQAVGRLSALLGRNHDTGNRGRVALSEQLYKTVLKHGMTSVNTQGYPKGH